MIALSDGWTKQEVISLRFEVGVSIPSNGGLKLGTESVGLLSTKSNGLEESFSRPYVGTWNYVNKCSRRAPGDFILIGDKAPPAARDSSEVAST